MDRLQRDHRRHQSHKTKTKRRFWLAAVNYYVLSSALAIAVFFLGWGIMLDLGERSPWIGAGLLASIVLAGAVLLREVIIRLNQRRSTIEHARLERTFKAAAALGIEADRRKVTLEQNEAWLKYIKKKSEAAKVLGKIADAHREVFELCDSYLQEIGQELNTVVPGSPRIPAFRKGLSKVGSIHRTHMLKWAEIESRQAIVGLDFRDNIKGRSDAAKNAESALSFALSYYPHDVDLKDSHALVIRIITTSRVADLSEAADHASQAGDNERARNLYLEAIDALGNFEVDEDPEAALILENLRERLRLLSSGYIDPEHGTRTDEY